MATQYKGQYFCSSSKIGIFERDRKNRQTGAF